MLGLLPFASDVGEPMEDRRYARFERRRKANAMFRWIVFAIIAACVFLLMFKFVFGF
jgi:hypothetical protein